MQKILAKVAMRNKRKDNCTHPLLIEATTTATTTIHIVPPSSSTTEQRIRLLWMLVEVRRLLLMMIRVKPSSVSASKLIRRITSRSSPSSAHITLLKWHWTTTSPIRQ
jgi:hypothetical protein